MPEISRFYGIVIQMYIDDHNPPHFHALYAGKVIVIGIEPLAVIEGDIQSRALSLTIEWASGHKQDLLSNWMALHTGQPIKKIKPLK